MDFFSDDSSDEDDDEGEEYSAPPEILFAELSFDQEKLTYVHFEWPHYEENVILEGKYSFKNILTIKFSSAIRRQQCVLIIR